MSTDPLHLIGQKVAEKYLVREVVGEGGFATVYRADHLIWQQPVAIKFFTELSRLRESSRDLMEQAFIQEGALLTELSSHTASIVQARDVGFHTAEDGSWVPFMVMEWLEGETLEDLLIRRDQEGQPSFSLEESWSYLRPVFEALVHAHALGVAHRDIKPSNIFLVRGEHESPSTAPSAIKLLDFGVAKMMSGGDISRELTQTGKGISSFTPNYGAPEQFSKKQGATGPWTDVFALALLFSEMLSGQIALAGSDIGELAFSSMDPGFRPTPRRLGAAVNDTLEAVFERALSIRPADRPRDAEQFCTELEEAMAAGPGLSVTPITRPQPRSLPPTGSDVVTAVEPELDRTPAAMVTPQTVPKSPPRKVLPFAIAGAVAAAAVGLALRPSNAQQQAPGGESTKSQGVSSAEPAAPSCPDGMLLIPAGQYFMGSDEESARDNEKPAHQVQLAAFCIDRTEVTVDAYRACSDDGKCRRAPAKVRWPGIEDDQKQLYSKLCNANQDGRGNHPVNCVTWQMADEYCHAQDKRLPTEAEWEYTARGPDGRIYPWGDEEPTAERLNACGTECSAWAEENGVTVRELYIEDDGYVGTAPVGTFESGSSRFGPVDVVGNVWEWVSDWDGAYEEAPLSNPKGPAAGQKKIIRGGAFNGGYASWLRPSFRYAQDPTAKSHAIGFRCAMGLPGPASDTPPSP